MEFSQADELQKAEEYRKQFIRLVIAQDGDIEDIIDGTRDDVQSLVKKNTRLGVLEDVDAVQSGLKPILAGWAGLYLLSITKFNASTAGLVGAKEMDLIASEYDNSSFNKLISKDAKNLEQMVSKSFVYRQFPSDGISVGSRIKTIQGEALKTARDIITVGINKGSSAKQIADNLDNFLKPSTDTTWVGPFDWFRQRFGYKVKKVPAGKPAGSLYFNSQRIARTEINHTYRLSTLQLHKGKPWVKGYIWNLSSAHPIQDICDFWADGSPYKDEREVSALGHPYCMCFVTIDMMSSKEI